MKYLKQFTIILVILYVSNFISELISGFFLLPGPILGMVLLFVLLKTGIIKLEQIEALSTFMFSIIAMFFLPSGISLINYLDLIYNSFIPIIFVGVVVTIITLALTMKFVEMLVNLTSKKEIEND
jgi:putative effector of murein hydrolase LrgA (UPF0299 family)